MKLTGTLKPLAAILSALLFAFALGPASAFGQDGTTVSIGSQEAQSGQSVDVPVEVSNFNDVGSVSLTINYDPNVLSLPEGASADSLISGAPRSGFSANVPEPGELRVSFFDATGENPLNLGDGTLLDITFSNFSGGTSEVAFGDGSEISDIQANPINATFIDGVVSDSLASLAAGSVQNAELNQVVSVPLSGEDLSNVGSLSLEVAFDQSALQFEGLASDTSGLDLQASANDGVVTIGGFNANGTGLSEGFAQLEFRFLGGSSALTLLSASSEATDAQGNVITTAFDAGAVSGDTPTVLVRDRDITAGGTTTIPVATSELQEVGSASIDISFNPAVLSFTGSEGGLEGFNLQVSNPESGTIRIAGFSSSGVDPAQNSNRLVALNFDVATGVSSGSQTQVQFVDSASEVTNPSGTRYNTVFDGGTLTEDPAPVDLTVDVSRSFENPSSQSSYELVALPGQADVDVAETLTGSQGTEWRAFREVGSSGGSGDAGLQSYDGTEAFNFRPGRAFWVLSTNDWSFSGTITAVDPADGTPTISLQDGWNAISNPLSTDLAWSGVQSANGLDQALFRWTDQGEWVMVDSLGSAQSGEAYYVLNSAGLDSLDLVSRAAGSQVAQTSGSETGSSDNPLTTQITASLADGRQTSSVTVGIGPEDGEPSAYRAPPARFGRMSLRIVGGSGAEYMQSVRPSEGNRALSFDLALAGASGQEVTIGASDFPTGASDFGVVLVDKATGERHDLQTGSATVTAESDTTSLRLLVGAERQLRQEDTPDETRLVANFPNPFTEQTTVEYKLAEKMDVNVSVYNVLGQQVATVERGTREAGTHEVQWNGGSLPSGTYFLRLKAGGETSTRKLTIIR